MPLFHIHGLIGAVLSSLWAGASVICTPGLAPNHFLGWLERLEPTWYTAVPTMHQAILSRATACRHRLRFIRSSSAALPPTVARGLEDAFGVPVLESYGMTEASHQMASNPLPPAERKPGSVGPPAGPEIRIIDGEICIRGENVTSGYEANPEANSGAFIDGWFRTGDQGRFDEDGYLYLTGRIKELINRGGEKIAPREIDEALLEHPAIQQAVAFAVPHERLGEDIGVAIVPVARAGLTEREVIEFAASRLADFKVPRVVRIVAEVPKGPTGKLQRIGLAKALGIESIGVNVAVRRSAPAPPRNQIERQLRAIWSDLLRVPDIGVEDDFFALGGDSLTAAQIVFRAQDELGMPLPLALFRTSPTIAAMAEALGRQRQARESGIAEGLVPVRIEGDGPALFCISGHDGGLLGFSNLAHLLPEGHPVFAFEPPQGGEINGIGRLAERYLAVMRAQQPEEPYRLLGHCFGGFVAYEMACRLGEGGTGPALLAMIECFNQRWISRLPAAGRARVKAVHFARRLRFHVEQAMRSGSPTGYLQARSRAADKERRERLEQAEYEACILEGRASRASQSAINRAASELYDPRPYSGPALLIAPAHPRARRYPAPLLGWSRLLTGPVDYLEVPDYLRGMLAEPAVATVAAEVGQRLMPSALIAVPASSHGTTASAP